MRARVDSARIRCFSFVFAVFVFAVLVFLLASGLKNHRSRGNFGGKKWMSESLILAVQANEMGSSLASGRAES